eukprot:3190179-Pleurochrysis_carterae.AAC.4
MTKRARRSGGGATTAANSDSLEGLQRACAWSTSSLIAVVFMMYWYDAFALRAYPCQGAHPVKVMEHI